MAARARGHGGCTQAPAAAVHTRPQGPPHGLADNSRSVHERAPWSPIANATAGPRACQLALRRPHANRMPRRGRGRAAGNSARACTRSRKHGCKHLLLRRVCFASLGGSSNAVNNAHSARHGSHTAAVAG